jgi:hypothetical protein
VDEEELRDVLGDLGLPFSEDYSLQGYSDLVVEVSSKSQGSHSELLCHSPSNYKGQQ